MKKKLLKSMRVLLVAAGLCVGVNVWADATPFAAPADNGDGTYTLNGSVYTKTTYSFTSEPSKGSAASKESASSKAAGYTDDATTRYKMGIGGSASVSDMITGLTFTNSSGTVKYIYFCSGYGLQSDDGGNVALTVTGQSDRTLAVLHYVTGDNTTTVAGGTSHTIAKKGTRISFTLGNKNASPYYLYTSIDVYEETKVGDFTYDSTTGYYKKNGVNYQRTTYDFGGLYFTDNLASSGGTTSSTTPTGFSGSAKCTRYKTNSYSTSGISALVDGLTFKPGTATAFYYLVGYGWQFDKTVTIKATDADAKTVSYLYYKQGDGVATTDFDAVAENYSTTNGTSTLSMSEKNSDYYYIYTNFVVFKEVGIGDFYAGGDGYYYTYSDLTDKTSPFARDLYDFTLTTNKYGDNRNTQNFSGFAGSASQYQTKISNGSSNSAVPTGLTFTNNSGESAYLQYFLGNGMQAGTKALTLKVTDATASTVSYLFYKQGAASATASVAETPESTPVKIIGTASTDIELKSSSYKLYTRLEVFTKQEQTVSVTSIGYATLCPSVNLNFSSATDIEACKASVDASGKITYTVVNTVKAGEGVLLRSKNGGAASETIPVIADATLNEGNAFVGIPEKVKLAQSTESGYTNYILSKVGDVLGFYKVNANGSWCNAGTAYLKVADSVSPARGFFALWGDEATGINAVAESKAADGQAYNLNGQRVAQPVKGLYIVNGKKVIIK